MKIIQEHLVRNGKKYLKVLELDNLTYALCIPVVMGCYEYKIISKTKFEQSSDKNRFEIF